MPTTKDKIILSLLVKPIMPYAKEREKASILRLKPINITVTMDDIKPPI